MGPTWQGVREREGEADQRDRAVRGRRASGHGLLRPADADAANGLGPLGPFLFFFVLILFFSFSFFCFVSLIHNSSFRNPNDFKQICKIILFDVLYNHTILGNVWII